MNEPNHAGSPFNFAGRRLYRDPDNGPLFGVCTGIAQYFGIEPWITRLACVLGVICIGWVVIPAYIIAIFVMDRRPDEYEESQQYSDSYRKSRLRRRYAKSKKDSERPVDQYEESSNFKWRMNVVRRDIRKMEQKLQRMETYVTSGRYELLKEFENISDK